MLRWATEFANRADDGAPYVGPIILADSKGAASVINERLTGPNGEPLVILGVIEDELNAEVHGDTQRTIRRV